MRDKGMARSESSQHTDKKMRLHAWIENKVIEENEVRLVVLYYHAAKHFGFGQSVVNKFLELLEGIGKIRVDRDLGVVYRE